MWEMNFIKWWVTKKTNKPVKMPDSCWNKLSSCIIFCWLLCCLNRLWMKIGKRIGLNFIWFPISCRIYVKKTIFNSRKFWIMVQYAQEAWIKSWIKAQRIQKGSFSNCIFYWKFLSEITSYIQSLLLNYIKIQYKFLNPL